MKNKNQNNNQHDLNMAPVAVILARVSSKEQEDGYSLQAQEANARNYCQNRGYRVLKVFSIVESSTQGNRAKFHQMLKYIKQQNGRVIVVSDTVDRFQRSFKETLEIDPMLKSGKVELHFLKNNLVIHQNSPASDKTMWSMCVLMAENYVLSLSDNTKRGLHQKVKNGEWGSKAPVGYKNVEGPNGKTIVLDMQTAPLVKKFFEDYATGNYSLEQAARDFKRAGIKSCRDGAFHAASMYRTLINPFYYGIMRVKEQLVPHRYPPIITKQLFDKCQKVRLGYQKQPLRYDKLAFTFKRMIKCACCDSYISSYHRHKKNKTNKGEHHYVYLRCAGKANKRTCNCGEIREEVAINAVMDKLRAIQVPSALLQRVLPQLVGRLHTQEQAAQLEQNNAHRRLGQIAREKEVWVQKEASGLISCEIVNAKLQALTEEEKTLQAKLANKQEIPKEAVWTLARVVNLLSRLPELFAGSQPEQKRKILNLIFANLRLKGKNLEIFYKKPFSLLAEGSKCCVWGTLIDYIYNYFSVNIIYWEVLLVRRERVMKNGTTGPSYNFVDMIRGN